jgi:lipopolysaccharide/colanic/teichoic acid biosynthesis glycosyltransferase
MDELPQVINVLRGDLSIVGPRPERPEFVTSLEKEIPYFDLRHIIKPGVTGWAQVKFKYAGSILESYQKFEYDMYYAKNRNLFMDFGIIFRTIQKLF